VVDLGVKKTVKKRKQSKFKVLQTREEILDIGLMNKTRNIIGSYKFIATNI